MTSYPFIGSLLKNYLDPFLSVPVVGKVPDPRPDSFVQIRRSGGGAQIARDTPLVDVFCWALTDEDAEDLCMTVRSLITDLENSMLGGRQIYRLEEFLGPTQDDDPETGTSRWWMTFSISIRAD